MATQEQAPIAGHQHQGGALMPQTPQFMSPQQQQQAIALWAAQAGQAQGLPNFYGYGGGLPYSFPQPAQSADGGDQAGKRAGEATEGAKQEPATSTAATATQGSAPMAVPDQAQQLMMALSAAPDANHGGINAAAVMASLAAMHNAHQQQQNGGEWQQAQQAASQQQVQQGQMQPQAAAQQVTSADGTETSQDPENEREQKKLRRKQSNRESARRSRMKKQAECEGLATSVSQLQAENARLKEENLQLQAKVEVLMAQLASSGQLPGKLAAMGPIENPVATAPQ